MCEVNWKNGKRKTLLCSETIEAAARAHLEAYCRFREPLARVAMRWGAFIMPENGLLLRLKPLDRDLADIVVDRTFKTHFPIKEDEFPPYREKSGFMFIELIDPRDHFRVLKQKLRGKRRNLIREGEHTTVSLPDDADVDWNDAITTFIARIEREVETIDEAEIAVIFDTIIKGLSQEEFSLLYSYFIDEQTLQVIARDRCSSVNTIWQSIYRSKLRVLVKLFWDDVEPMLSATDRSVIDALYIKLLQPREITKTLGLSGPLKEHREKAEKAFLKALEKFRRARK